MWICLIPKNIYYIITLPTYILLSEFNFYFEDVREWELTFKLYSVENTVYVCMCRVQVFDSTVQ